MKKFEKFITAGTGATFAYKNIIDGYRKAREYFSYSLTIDPDVTDIFNELTKMISGQDTKHFEVKTYVDSSSNRKVFFSPAGTIEKPITIGGYRYKFRIEKESLGTYVKRKIILTCFSVEANEFLKNTIAELQEKTKRQKRCTYNSYGEWNSHTLPRRELSTVFLDDGIKESVIEDVDNFLIAESKYAGLGLPWHRGYLFHGEPGSGKTSMVHALATYLGRDLYTMSLSSFKDDKTFTEAFDKIGCSLLLIEDIDTYSKTMSRKQANEGVTLGALLNALDGIGTPHGIITVCTTNNKEALDKALVRPGRLDRHYEFKRPTEEIVIKYSEFAGVDVEFSGQSMAEITNIVKEAL